MAKGYKDLLLKEVLELFKKLPPNVRLRVYYEDMGKSKYTLSQVCTKLDQIGDALFEFIKTTNARFDKLEKDFNTRLDRVENRLDRVENRLDLVEKRLDYNGLQIERIEKRLDYNNLKKLPETR